MNENLASVLAWMYPDADTFEDFRVETQNGQLVIIYWNTAKLGPQPTAEEIAQEELPYLRWKRKTDVRIEENEYIAEQIQPYTRDQLRDGPPAISAEVAEVMLNFIADCHEAVNAFDDAVDAATIENINVPAVDWPEYEGPAQ